MNKGDNKLSVNLVTIMEYVRLSVSVSVSVSVTC